MANSRRHRSFSPKMDENPEPITFDLYGQEFTARPEIPGAIILDFASAGDTEGGSTNVRAITNFFEVALEEESLTRFNKLIRDPETLVKIEVLTDILEFLVEEYASRPTMAS